MAKNIINECHEVTAKFLVRKDYWDGPMTVAVIKDKIQQGIEVPIEKKGFEVDIK